MSFYGLERQLHVLMIRSYLLPFIANAKYTLFCLCHFTQTIKQNAINSALSYLRVHCQCKYEIIIASNRKYSVVKASFCFVVKNYRCTTTRWPGIYINLFELSLISYFHSIISLFLMSTKDGFSTKINTCSYTH